MILTCSRAFYRIFSHEHKNQQDAYAMVSGPDLYYEIYGSGQPLVLLPGGFMTIEAMGELVPQLALAHVVECFGLLGGAKADGDLAVPRLPDSPYSRPRRTWAGTHRIMASSRAPSCSSLSSQNSSIHLSQRTREAEERCA